VEAGRQRLALLLGQLGQVQVLRVGTRISAVVTVDDDAHTSRRVAGCDAAQLDPMTLAIWEWPESRGGFPPTVVTLVGVSCRWTGAASGGRVPPPGVGPGLARRLYSSATPPR
jgi:hypothetical protein